MNRLSFMLFGLTLSLFSFNHLLADEIKKEATTANPVPTSENKDGKIKDKDDEEEEDVAQADILSQQRVNDQFRSAQPSGMIDSYRTGNQGPISRDGYYDYNDDSQNYDRRQQGRRGGN